jgi:hypothetical protein
MSKGLIESRATCSETASQKEMTNRNDLNPIICAMLLGGCAQNSTKPPVALAQESTLSPVPANSTSTPRPAQEPAIDPGFIRSYAKQLAGGWNFRWIVGTPLSPEQWNSDPFLHAQLLGRVPAGAFLYPVRLRFTQTSESQTSDAIKDVYFFRDSFGEWAEALSVDNPVSTFR